ncbi:imidazole glycerol phosphate synthase cyclase subunit [Xenorhabdus bovienii]|uniref:imidazole glycerol phosphate synthase cyclase subunit n=1 Tax=Xenorhabdus bovienii TaxID=40576 RepID=UPI001EDE0C15|nr:imidazole glycerol phosphate synthase cyclase subunit [Xenorhabdus bovienii]MCG3470210.1 imidazole glycerol phosphate synthase cyclase subunit [Xenorhabdus bovienii]
MLKTRLIPCIIIKNELVVQSFNFNNYLPIGNIKTAIEFFVNWDVDEIIIIDIDATREKRSPNIDLVKWAASECFVPLTVGGGISNIDHINDLLKAGADKVCLNSIASRDVNFITQASNKFGSQCITVSIDAKKDNNEYKVFDHLCKNYIETSLDSFVKMVEEAGAGEILLNSVDRDGSRQGYDIELLKKVSSSVNIPVIALGGIGRFDQLASGVTLGRCQAVAAANIFQHMEHSTIAAKAQMRASNLNVRLSSKVKYEDFTLDFLGRPY